MTVHDLIEEEINKLQATSTPPWNSATSERALRDALLTVAEETLIEVDLPYHLSMTNAAEAETESVKLLRIMNEAWNNAVNGLHVKAEAWMKKP